MTPEAHYGNGWNSQRHRDAGTGMVRSIRALNHSILEAGRAAKSAAETIREFHLTGRHSTREWGRCIRCWFAACEHASEPRACLLTDAETFD